jgi:Homing endonuclease associated repeat
MTNHEGGKETILAAIRRAAAELGRAPSRGELRRITGVSHYRVLAEFPTLRGAVRAAGLEPNPKGEKISTEDLLSDWKRVAEKLGRRPSRTEYVREGKYSAGALTVRFGSWSGISTAKNAKQKPFSRELTRRTRINQNPEKANHKGRKKTQRKTGAGKWIEEHGESVLRDFDRVPLALVPSPVVGMRRVTEEVAQMVVNTLLAPGNWQLAISQNQKQNPFTTEGTEEHGGKTSGDPVTGTSGDRLVPRGVKKEGDLGPSLAINAPRVQDDDLMRRDLARRGLYKDRPVMGEPFDRRPMTNAPVNELGVMVLFGMVAAGLGLQVESVQGKFPDCIARRQVAPGKWQHLRIEFEYESKNFKLHGHDPKGCDMIVCWRHNWKECPAEIEVVELCSLIGIE